jgi:hypothetical protein
MNLRLIVSFRHPSVGPTVILNEAKDLLFQYT